MFQSRGRRGQGFAFLPDRLFRGRRSRKIISGRRKAILWVSAIVGLWPAWLIALEVRYASENYDPAQDDSDDDRITVLLDGIAVLAAAMPAYVVLGSRLLRVEEAQSTSIAALSVATGTPNPSISVKVWGRSFSSSSLTREVTVLARVSARRLWPMNQARSSSIEVSA